MQSSTAITTSDYRMKENVSYHGIITTRLKQLKPVDLILREFDSDKTTVDGFIAHEVSSIVQRRLQELKTLQNYNKCC